MGAGGAGVSVFFFALSVDFSIVFWTGAGVAVFVDFVGAGVLAAAVFVGAAFVGAGVLGAAVIFGVVLAGVAFAPPAPGVRTAGVAPPPPGRYTLTPTVLRWGGRIIVSQCETISTVTRASRCSAADSMINRLMAELLKPRRRAAAAHLFDQTDRADRADRTDKMDGTNETYTFGLSLFGRFRFQADVFYSRALYRSNDAKQNP